MKTYLFDLDGTLLDSIELILESFRYTARVHLKQEFSDAHWLAGIGTPLRDQLGAIAKSQEDRDAMLDTYRDYNLEHHDAMAKPYPGVVEVVKTLHARGATLALVTSKMSRGALRGLQLLGLEGASGSRLRRRRRERKAAPRARPKSTGGPWRLGGGGRADR